MKLDDKTIELITAMLTAEIEEEEAKAAKAAAEVAGETVAEETVAGEAVEEMVAEEPKAEEVSTAAETPVTEPIVVEAEAPVTEPTVEPEPAPAEVPDGTVSRDTSFLDVEALLEEINHMTDDMAVLAEHEVAESEVVAEESETDEDAAEESTDDSEPSETDEEDAENESAADEEIADDSSNESAGVPAPVKSSKASDIAGIIIYVVTVIAITVLSAVGVNLLDKNLQQFKPVIPEDVAPSNLAASLQTYTANQVIENEGIKQYSLNEIYALDLRTPSGATEADLKKVSKAGLVGLEDTFLEAEEKYGVNAIFLMSIASLESAHGTQMYRPNNMFGYGGKSYPSKEACIMDVAQGLSSRYLKPGASLYGGSPTLKGVNKRYAANPQWYAKVGKYMKSYYDVIAPYHNQTLEKIK